MTALTHHIFVCCNTREPNHPRGCCDPEGTQALRQCFKDELKRRGLQWQVRANEAGCLDRCEAGPTVVIYPQAIWYGHVTPADVPRIIEQTIVAGQCVAELQLPVDPAEEA